VKAIIRASGELELAHQTHSLQSAPQAPMFGAEKLLARWTPMLAMYFYFSALVAILLILQAAVATYPLLQTLRADRYRSSFYVTEAQPGWEPSHGSNSSRAVLECQTPFSDAHSLLQWSVGNFCPPNGFSSLRDCSSECRLIRAAPAALTCADVEVLTPQESCSAPPKLRTFWHW
jgi:hypothetical protein